MAGLGVAAERMSALESSRRWEGRSDAQNSNRPSRPRAGAQRLQPCGARWPGRQLRSRVVKPGPDPFGLFLRSTIATGRPSRRGTAWAFLPLAVLLLEEACAPLAILRDRQELLSNVGNALVRKGANVSRLLTQKMRIVFTNDHRSPRQF
jgi:hypothetical protein